MATTKIPIIAEFGRNVGQVGDVVDSVLDEATLQSLRGSGWVLMDGRDITGSTLADLTGWTNLPDARGQFRRAKNNGRSDGKENPDGDLALGQFQQDQQETVAVSHNHRWHYISGNSRTYTSSGSVQNFSFQGPNGNAAISATASVDDRINTNAYTSNESGASTNNETRVKNITINTYIRID
jgi:hypothetical protein